MALDPAASAAGLIVTGTVGIGSENDHGVLELAVLRPAYAPHWNETAALIVEIVAPRDDTWDKRPFYAAHHVDEVVIVDPGEAKILWLGLNGGEYRPIEHSRLVAATLPASSLRLNTTAGEVAEGAVKLTSGERISAQAIVVATDGVTAHRLLGALVPDPGSRAVACCWFATATQPIRGPFLILDGTMRGPALNVVVVSEVQPSYAPPGHALIAAAVPGPPRA